MLKDNFVAVDLLDSRSNFISDVYNCYRSTAVETLGSFYYTGEMLLITSGGAAASKLKKIQRKLQQAPGLEMLS